MSELDNQIIAKIIINKKQDKTFNAKKEDNAYKLKYQ